MSSLQFIAATTIEREREREEERGLTRSIVGVSRIPMSDAARLVNKTVPLAEYPGEYVVSLDVFHQLHCLVSDKLLLK